MLKSRILLALLIMVASAAIYFLPRYVVSNEEPGNAPTESGTTTDQADTSDAHQHALVIPDSLSARFETFYELYTNAENQEKRFIFADSLAKAYKVVGFQDSSAKYSEIKALEIPTLENLLQAAEGYYAAMNFATNPNDRALLAVKARDYYNRVLNENPKMLDVKAKVAMTLTYGSNPMEGIMMLREILNEDPDNEVATFNLGMLAITSGQYDKAMERFEKLLQLNPANTEANFYMGFCLIELGKSTEAVPYFEKVTQSGQGSNLQRAANEYLKSIIK
jgi:outer membrane protein